MDRDTLEQRLSRIKGVSPLPVVAANVIRLTQNPRSSALEIGNAIARDQALTSKVLRIANSAFYGFPRKITTVNYAIVVLGFVNIRNIVLSASLGDLLAPGSENPFFDREAFWKHSLACGIASKLLAVRLGLKNTDEAFIWGLLHDFGKVVMDTYLHDEFSAAVKTAAEKGMLLREAEESVLGFDHTLVGSMVAEKWNLPPALIRAIRFHHDPEKDFSSIRISSIVHLADIFCRKIGLGSGGDARVPPIKRKSWDLLNLDQRSIDILFDKIRGEFETAGTFLAPLHPGTKGGRHDHETH